MVRRVINTWCAKAHAGARAQQKAGAMPRLLQEIRDQP